MKFPFVAERGKRSVNRVEIVPQHDEVQVHGGTLYAAHGHAESADQGITYLDFIQFAADLADDLQKVQSCHS